MLARHCGGSGAAASSSSSNSAAKRAPRAAAAPGRRALCVRAVAEPAADAAAAPGSANGSSTHAGNGAAAKKPEHFINVIEGTAWEKGIPRVMGAHLMASGTIAPISTSKGAGIDVDAHQFQYPGEGEAQVIVYFSQKNASKGVAKLLSEAAAEAIAEKGSFTLVLSGGSALTTLGGLSEAKVDWSKVWVFFVDERNVALTSEDSNYKGAKEALLGRVPIPEAQVFPIAEGLTVQQAATEYEGRLLALPAGVLPRDAEGLPVFDSIVLGIGPDGHVASLFPNRPEIADASGRWVLPVSNSPKPPPERITLSLPVINAAKGVMVLALGASKAEIVQRALEVQALPGALPAQLVRPKASRVRWVLDASSAENLNIGEWDSAKDFPRNK